MVSVHFLMTELQSICHLGLCVSKSQDAYTCLVSDVKGCWDLSRQNVLLVKFGGRIRAEGLYHFYPFLINIFPFCVRSTVLNKKNLFMLIYTTTMSTLF